MSGPGDGQGEKKKRHPAVLFLRDAGIAFSFVACILLAMFAYTGLWPPLVVVESNSMMHSEDNVSYIGVIDTGDLVLVKDVGSASDVVTYVEGAHTGHETYGDYGDVIVYRINGDDARTPIIHRAMVYLEANLYSRTFRCEALAFLERGPTGEWDTSNPTDTWDNLSSTLLLYHVGYNDLTVSVNLGTVISYYRNTELPDGFVTKGDHNLQTDVSGLLGNRLVAPGWIVGKARGEIPWFGLLKLWSTHSLESPAPPNSVRDLWIAMAVIVIAPIGLDIILTYRLRRRIARRREVAVRENELETQGTAPEDGIDRQPPAGGGTTEGPEPPGKTN